VIFWIRISAFSIMIGMRRWISVVTVVVVVN
jgi:hypothetical protein